MYTIWQFSNTNCHIGKMTYTFSLWQFFSYGNFFYSPNAVPCVVVQLHFQFDCCICLFVAWVAIFCILFSVFCFLFSVFRFFLLFYVFRFLFIVFQFQLFIFGFSVFHFWFSFFSVSIFSFFAFCFPFLLSVFRFHCPILLTSYRFKAKPDPLVWTLSDMHQISQYGLGYTDHRQCHHHHHHNPV